LCLGNAVATDVMREMNESPQEQQDEDASEPDLGTDPNTIVLAYLTDMGVCYLHETKDSFYIFIRKLPNIVCSVSPPQTNGVQLNWHAIPPPDTILSKLNIPVHEYGMVESDTKVFITSPNDLSTGKYDTYKFPEEGTHEWLIIKIPWAQSLQDNVIDSV
jgi:hypothetical protein